MKTSRVIARFGMVIALIVAAYFIDTMISKPLPTRIAVTSLIVVMTLSQLIDYKTAVFSTTMFGISSFVFAYIFWNTSSFLFIQPQISILPRIMIGVVSYGVFLLMTKLLKNGKTEFVKKVIPSAVAAASGVLTNTSLVLLMISFADNRNFLYTFFKTIIGINFAVEFVCVILVVPAISVIVRKNIKKYIQR